MADKKLSDLTDDDFRRGVEAIQSALLDFREGRISNVGETFGLVVRELDGRASNVIRLTTEEAMRMFVKAVLDG